MALFGAVPAMSGVSVTPSTAMQCAPVRCAVQTIAEAVGQLPIHVYERSDDGAKNRAPDHPAQSLLHDAANDWTPASDLREQVTRDALLHGNGYAFINRVDGRPIELLRLDPTSIIVKADEDTGEPIYQIKDGAKVTRIIPRQNVLHIRAPSLDGISGDSPVRQAREAIGLAIVMEQYAARLFGRGARPSGILKFPTKLGADTATRISTSWHAAHGGDASGKTAVLEEGGEFQALSLTSVDAQFLELRNFAVTEIARVFRVPPTFLQDYGRATWANSESMRRDFIDFTLRRWLSAWEGEIRLKLFSREERETYFAEFLLDDFVKGDLATRMDAYAKAIASRTLSPNEARAMENRGPYAGGEKFENPNTVTGVAA